MQHRCLTIAGFDGSGGAGMQADLKTFSAFGCYGLSVLTALPVQNTLGVKNCYHLPLECITEQLTAIFEDIVPHSIKIGMLFSSEIIQLVSDFLKQNAQSIPIVLDPVMISKSGHALLKNDAVTALKKELLPICTIVTPNLYEAQALVNSKTNDQRELAEKIIELGAQSVLVKGGHLDGDESNDYFLDQVQRENWFKNPRIQTKNTHGTGCTLSSAIASCLARGMTLSDACHLSKKYLSESLFAARDLFMGKGNGSLHHFYNCERFG